MPRLPTRAGHRLWQDKGKDKAQASPSLQETWESVKMLSVSERKGEQGLQVTTGLHSYGSLSALPLHNTGGPGFYELRIKTLAATASGLLDSPAPPLLATHM